MATATQRQMDIGFYGNEPDWPIVSNLDLTKALNWYSYMGDNDIASILEYMRLNSYTLEDMKIVSRVEDAFSSSHFGIARMWLRHVELPQEVLNKLEAKISEVIVKAITQDTMTVKVKEAPKVTMYHKSIEVIDSLQDIIATTPDFDITVGVNFSKMSATEFAKVKAFYKPKVDELKEAMAGTDKELLMSYGSTKAILAQLRFFATIFNEPLVVSAKQKASPSTPEVTSIVPQKKERKPRKRKINLRLLKYKVEDAEAGLKSVSPLTIHGNSSMLVTYNPKYEKMTVYFAEVGKKLEFKRTSVINYDEQKSYSKKVGRAKNLMDVVKNGGKREILNALTAVNTKEGAVSSVINADVLLMRTFA